MLNDNVAYVPGQYHKGILYNHPAGHDELHVWPLEIDERWGPDPDAHPYHDEYGRENNLQVPHDYEGPKRSQTRFYIDPKGQVRGYGGLGYPGAYANHEPATLIRRVNEHIPDAQWTTKPQSNPWDEGDQEMNWVSHTLGAAPVTVENVPGEPQMWHSDDRPYLYHTPSRTLYLGEQGAYHADMDRTHPAIKDYWEWSHGYGTDYKWLRGRFDEWGVDHHDKYGIQGERDAELLQPHFDAIEDAVGKQQVDESDFDWTTSHTLPHTLGSRWDRVELKPGWTHKGILTDDDELHIWPVSTSEEYGGEPDPDGYPYHEDYSISHGIPTNPKTNTRFYLEDVQDAGDGTGAQVPKAYVETYYDKVGDPNHYAAHSTDELMQRIQEHVPHASLWGNTYRPKPKSPEEEFSWSDADFPSPRYTHTLPSGELHIALDVPERIRLQIARWVENLGLPRHSLVDPLTYHITVAYSGSGVENVQAHEIRNNFNLTGLKFTGVRLTSFDNEALVIELENPYFTEWAPKLADYLEERGIDCERYDGGPKPHITIAQGVSKSAPLPPISFRCGGLSISTPRSASQTALGPYTAAAPRIVEHPGTANGVVVDDWTRERQPFIYDSRSHSIHVGPIGQHHGFIEDKMGGRELEYAPFRDKQHLYLGMMWHNPENIAPGLGIDGGISWWRTPQSERADAVDRTLRRAYPTANWGTHTLPEPEEEDWSTADDDYLQLNSKTAASPPATPPPWRPGTWGKALFIDHPELGQQLSAWTTGTKSLVGGTPHHNQVAEGHHGIEWGDMIDMMRAKQCYLLKVEPDGKTYECAMGYSLPPSFHALGAQHGLYEPQPYEEPEEDDWTT